MPASITHQMIRIKASDGFETDTYHVSPATAPKAGVIVIMEAFGLNEGIKRVADDYAAQGYEVLAPALYDRLERDVQMPYDGDIQKVIDIMTKNGFDNPMADVAGCVSFFHDMGIQKIGIVGYCYGGGVSWLAAARFPEISAASCYYGTGILSLGDESPRCPTIAHWGKSDGSTPPEKVDDIARANPDVAMYWYDAGHGFNSQDRAPSYNGEAAKKAREVTLAFFDEHLRQ